MNIYSLEGRAAIVTGALGLLGRQHCIALAEAGANVIVSDLDEDKCKAFASLLPVYSIGAGADITDKASIERLLDISVNEFGHIDILVNNAAINDMFENPAAALDQSKFENYPVELFRRTLEVNVMGMFITSQVIGSFMERQSKGSIINIASTYGIVAPDQSLYQKPDGTQAFYKSPAYPASKGAVISFTKFLAAYWARSGIRVNSLSPGGVENNQDEFFINNYSRRTPMGRMAQPGDYKGAIVFLSSDASAYMTGANLVVDGGWTVW